MTSAVPTSRATSSKTGDKASGPTAALDTSRGAPRPGPGCCSVARRPSRGDRQLPLCRRPAASVRRTGLAAAVELAQPHGLPGFGDRIALLDLPASLPDDRLEAFILTQLLGLPHAKAAEVSDCPIGTVRSRVARARATLMDLLDEA